MKIILYNAIIVDRGCRRLGRVTVVDQLIASVEADPSAPTDDADVDLAIDLNGAYLLPGAIDTHVHFREPGLTRKGSIASESAAAVAGGVTSYLEMPNTAPPTISIEAVDDKIGRASKSSLANFGFFIGATNSNIDQLLAVDRSKVPGVKLFMGSSTGNMLVDDDSTISRLFRDFKGVIAVHAEDEATIAANRARLKEQYGDEAPVTLHHQLRSAEACATATARAVELAKRFDARLHVLHISTAAELPLFTSGPIASKRITAETCPHYLLFNSDMLACPDGHFKKCNPAIKSEADRQALIQAVADGVIDTIATDHAPHTRDDKAGSLFTAASGMPGIKFMLPMLFDLAADPATPISIEQIVEKCCNNPAALYGINRRGAIEPGYFADLTVVAPCDPYTITHADALSHLPADYPQGPDWTPYAGLTCSHRVALTLVNGQILFNGSKINPDASPAMPLAFNQ